MKASLPARVPRALPSLALIGALLCGAGALPTVTGCIPVMIGAGVGATAMVASNRRTAGAQVDDESIELKINTAITSSYGESVHVNVTSYNAMVLLVGEVPTKVVLDDVLKVARTTERVKQVESYIVVGPNSDMSSRTNDSYITSKVKARFVEADKISANDFKVVTERAVVYLMGIVTRSEADTAAKIAATTSGVAKVVKVLEYTN